VFGLCSQAPRHEVGGGISIARQLFAHWPTSYRLWTAHTCGNFRLSSTSLSFWPPR
jgi:hypothetical protein